MATAAVVRSGLGCKPPLPAGWRLIYAAAGVLALVLAVLLHCRIPTLPARERISYPALLASVGRVIARHRTVRWSLALGAMQFGLFTMFWTALTFYLSAAPYGYSVTTIGLFGLVGLAWAPAGLSCLLRSPWQHSRRVPF